MGEAPFTRESGAMNERRLTLSPSAPVSGLPSNVIVLPLESTIPAEMTLDEWRHRKLASAAKRRRHRQFFTPPAREAA
jgi:hypothetical protein